MNFDKSDFKSVRNQTKTTIQDKTWLEVWNKIDYYSLDKIYRKVWFNVLIQVDGQVSDQVQWQVLDQVDVA